MDKVKGILKDVRWLIAIASAIYAICVNIYVLEGLPTRVSKLEAWQASAEEYHHRIDLTQMKIATSLESIEANVALLLSKVLYNDRTQGL